MWRSQPGLGTARRAWYGLLITPIPGSRSSSNQSDRGGQGAGNEPRSEVSVHQHPGSARTEGACRQRIEVRSSGCPHLLRPQSFSRTPDGRTNGASEGRIYQPFKDGKWG